MLTSAITPGTMKMLRHWNFSSFLNLSIMKPANCVPRKSPTPVVAAKSSACIELVISVDDLDATSFAYIWPTMTKST